MRKATPWIVVIFLIIGGGTWLLQAQGQQQNGHQGGQQQGNQQNGEQQGNGNNPAVRAPTITPNLITVNTPTELTAIVSIPDPTLNPTTVQLLRINADGTTALIVQMNDTGKGGDRRPGDKVFTGQFSLNESRPGTFGFQVAANFRGQNRTLSSVQQFVVLASHALPVVLPPDPGVAGKATLAGIDSDGDGVRDDVERYIVFTYYASEKTRAALLQMAAADQQYLLSSSPADALVKANSALQAKDCLYSFLGGIDNGQLVRHALEAELLNTKERSAAYLNAEHSLAGQEFTPRPSENNSTSCRFDQSRMSN